MNDRKPPAGSPPEAAAPAAGEDCLRELPTSSSPSLVSLRTPSSADVAARDSVPMLSSHQLSVLISSRHSCGAVRGRGEAGRSVGSLFSLVNTIHTVDTQSPIIGRPYRRFTHACRRMSPS